VTARASDSDSDNLTHILCPLRTVRSLWVWVWK